MIRYSKIRQRLHDIFLGFTMALAVLIVWSWISRTNLSYGFSGISFLICSLIGSLLMWGRKLTQKTASKVLAKDQRPPVLYLRSFKDDAITSRPVRERDFPIFFTEEEYLIDVLHDFGPCIAIGQPGEKFADLGAARMYVDHDKWHDKVKELLISSKLVVLRVGKTSNFLWEVQQTIGRVHPEHIILLIPRMKNIYKQFHALANKYFPKPLPDSIGDATLFLGAASLHGYVYFDADWTSHFIKFEFQIPFWQRRMADPIEYIIRNSFAPIYERFGIPVPNTEASSFGLIIAAFFLSILGLFILGRLLNS
jgi:hypothetical protein